jgi:CRISPR-associated exonuclease Cas4
MFEDTRVTGTEVNYYFVCTKKLWFFAHGIQMEQTSDRVYMGKLMHEDSFTREDKEILIDGTIKLDFIKKSLEIHESKLSNFMQEATLFQILYYIYYLKGKGVENIKGYVHFPKSKRKEEVQLTEEYEQQLQEVIQKILDIKQSSKPPVIEEKKICKKCSYYNLCFC